MLSFIHLLFSSHVHSAPVSSNAHKELVGNVSLDAFSLLWEFLKTHPLEYSSTTSTSGLILYLDHEFSFSPLACIIGLDLDVASPSSWAQHPVPPTVQTPYPLMRSTSLPSPAFALRTHVLAGSVTCLALASCLCDLEEGVQCEKVSGQQCNRRPSLSPFLLKSSVPL